MFTFTPTTFYVVYLQHDVIQINNITVQNNFNIVPFKITLHSVTATTVQTNDK